MINVKKTKINNVNMGIVSFDQKSNFKFNINKISLNNSSDKLFSFMMDISKKYPEYDTILKNMVNACEIENWEDFFVKSSDLKVLSRTILKDMNINVDEYCDSNKKTDKSIFVDKKQMTQLLETIITLKLMTPFLMSNNMFSEYIYKKIMYFAMQELFDNGLIDVLYKLIQKTSFVFNISDKSLWKLCSLKYGNNNIGYQLIMLNTFLHQIIMLYDFDMKKNPMTFINVFIKESFGWMLKSYYNDINVLDDTANITYQKKFINMDLDKLIMNEITYNNHILFGLKYFYDDQSVNMLIKTAEQLEPSPIMYTIGSIITSKITGISVSFLNERKNNHIILNNLFISKLISKVYHDNEYYQKLAMLLRLTKVKTQGKVSRLNRQAIKKNYNKILETNINFYGIRDRTMILTLLNNYIENMRLPQVYDVVNKKVITLNDNWVETVLKTLDMLFNDNYDDFYLKEAKNYFRYMITLKKNKNDNKLK